MAAFLLEPTSLAIKIQCDNTPQFWDYVNALSSLKPSSAYESENQDTGNPLVEPREDYGSGVSPQERADTGISDLQIPLNPQVVADCAERALQALVDEAQEMGLYDNGHNPATPIEPMLNGIHETVELAPPEGIVGEELAARYLASCKTGNCED